ncbi:MAG: FAD-dependent oxidoreductase [Clostridia bacterium]|nr:FAD-dependent oxidoreductase [Clostridia bacterium]MDQ7792350.1 FAD-dependent oxidoreductase [Clostridia bacterium]
MATVAIIGAGFAGHTAALYLGHRLGRDHHIVMISKNDYFLYLPSLVWVGVGHMPPEKVRVPLKPVYDRMHVHFVQGTAREVHPDENYVLVEKAGGGPVRVNYDYLLVATGPKLNFEGTPGLGPQHGHTLSICCLNHAIQCRDAYGQCIERMKRGERVRMVIGVGHPRSTCQGAAFEYITNVHKDLVKLGLRDRAELMWFSNEPAIGDFGVGGVYTGSGSRVRSSEDFTTSIFREFDIKWQVRKGARHVVADRVYWEDYEGNFGETEYDFAMLIPQFIGSPLKYIGRNGEDVSSKLVNQDGFVIVDGFYGLPYERLVYTPEAWPATYQNPNYRNIFAAGIAFAAPGSISVPHITRNGTNMTASAPRTGMVSGTIGRLVAKNIISLLEQGRMTHQERMTEMFSACIASMSGSLWDGSAVSITLFPTVPNFLRYRNRCGRDAFGTRIEIGLAGAWMKRMIHTTMLWKVQGNLGWRIIPE